MQARKKLSSLSENTFLRYFNFTALYFSEGINMGMLFVGIPAWLAANGKTPTEIGAFATACALPWTFKFVVAPLMDRYVYLPMGRKRPWVLFGQAGLVIGLVFLALVPDPLDNLDLLMSAAFTASLFGAVQDAATDGMAVDLIPAEQQARANGLMGGSRMIGSSFALALGSWLLNAHGFAVAMLAIASILGVLTLVPLLLRERGGERIAPWTAGEASQEAADLQAKSWSAIIKSLFVVFRLRNSLLIALLLFITQGAYNYFETLLPLFTVKNTGWTNVTYSQYFATADLVGGIGGMLLGGVLIEKFGKKRMINIYFVLIIVATITLTSLKNYWDDSSFLFGFILVYRWLNAFAKIGLFAVAMECCWRKVSASQFTFYMTLGAVGSMVGATLIGPVKENFSWEITMYAFAGMMVLAWLIMQFLNIDRLSRQIETLEEKDVESRMLAEVG